MALHTSAERALEIIQRDISQKDEEDNNLMQNLRDCLLANNFKDPEVFFLFYYLF